MNGYLKKLSIATSFAFLLLAPIVWMSQYYGLPWLQGLQLEAFQSARIRILAIVIIVVMFFHLQYFDKLSRVIKWWVIFLTLFGIEMVSAELYPVEKIVKVTQADEQLGWTWIPGATRETDYDGRKFTLRFNSLGLRGPEITEHSDILFLGNSITQAQHFPEDLTFVGILNGVNAGFDGYNTMRERDRFQRDLHKLNIDKVVLIASAGDIMTEQSNRDAIKETLANNTSIAGVKDNFFQQLLTPLDQLAMKKLLIMKAKESQQRKDDYYTSVVMRTRDTHTWKEWTQAILEIKQLVGNNNFYFVLSPPRSIVELYRNGTRSFWANENIKQFCQQNQIPYHDLLPALAELPGTQTYVDAVHFNAKGHEIVAASISEFLTKAN